jgi:hypothetical protein
MAGFGVNLYYRVPTMNTQTQAQRTITDAALSQLKDRLPLIAELEHLVTELNLDRQGKISSLDAFLIEADTGEGDRKVAARVELKYGMWHLSFRADTDGEEGEQ